MVYISIPYYTINLFHKQVISLEKFNKEEKAYAIEQYVIEFDRLLGCIDLIIDMINRPEKDIIKLKRCISKLEKINNEIKNADKFSDIEKHLNLKKLYKRMEKHGEENLFNW